MYDVRYIRKRNRREKVLKALLAGDIRHNEVNIVADSIGDHVKTLIDLTKNPAHVTKEQVIVINFRKVEKKYVGPMSVFWIMLRDILGGSKGHITAPLELNQEPGILKLRFSPDKRIPKLACKV